MMDVHERIEELADDPSPAAKIVVAIWRDATDRRGWRQEHDQFDAAVQMEIVETWLTGVRAILKEPSDEA
jgi:hypothetical protein